MSSQVNNLSVRTATVQCGSNLGVGIAAIAGLVVLVGLMMKTGDLISIAWPAWQSLLTNHWTNVWPATWIVWICTLLAAWCACMAYKLGDSRFVLSLSFAAACTVLILFGALPANCAAWAIVEDWNMDVTALLDKVAAESAFVFALVACVTPVIGLAWVVTEAASAS
jgi:hypothetical protein